MSAAELFPALGLLSAALALLSALLLWFGSQKSRRARDLPPTHPFSPLPGVIVAQRPKLAPWERVDGRIIRQVLR